MNEKCKHCGNELPQNGDYVECERGCRGNFHYGVKCSGIAKETWRSKSLKAKSEWKCKDCRDSKTKQKGEGGRKASKNEEEDLVFEHDENEALNSKGFDDKDARIARLEERVKILEEKIVELLASVQYTSTDCEEMKSKNESQQEEIKKLKTNLNSVEVEQKKNKKETEKIKDTQNKNSQYDRNRNIEIYGLKKTEKENLPEIINSLAGLLEIEDFNVKDIDAMHRIPKSRYRSKKGEANKEQPDTIIVQFNTRTARNKWLEKRRRITNEELFDDSPDKAPIYINEHLTVENKKLLWMTKSKARECKWKFVWTRDGKILCRKEEGERYIHIQSEEDLRLISETPVTENKEQ